MAKAFIRVMAGTLPVPSTQKTIVVNTGISPIFICDEATSTALEELEVEESDIVKRALFGLAPGATVKLQAGTYAVDFDNSVSASAIAFIDVTEPKPSAKPKPDEKQAE